MTTNKQITWARDPSEYDTAWNYQVIFKVKYTHMPDRGWMDYCRETVNSRATRGEVEAFATEGFKAMANEIQRNSQLEFEVAAHIEMWG